MEHSEARHFEDMPCCSHSAADYAPFPCSRRHPESWNFQAVRRVLPSGEPPLPHRRLRRSAAARTRAPGKPPGAGATPPRGRQAPVPLLPLLHQRQDPLCLPREDPHRGATLRVLHLREGLCAEGGPQHPPEDPHARGAVCVPDVREGLCAQAELQETQGALASLMWCRGSRVSQGRVAKVPGMRL